MPRQTVSVGCSELIPMNPSPFPHADPPRRALVVDDHPLAAHGVAHYLGSHGGMAHVDVAASLDEALDLLQQVEPPDLAVVDFWLPGGHALSLISHLRQQCPDTRVLVLSGDSDQGIALRVRQADAHGHLHKHDSPDVFLQAVTTVLNGGRWFSNIPPTPLGGHQAPSVTVFPHELGLTPRQGQVLNLVLRGLPNKRIANVLDLSEPTVKEHVTAILLRLGVSNRVEAITRMGNRRIEC